ncbi:MAG TPA: hypothetical protein VJ970_01210 [Flavobacteriaceae bacterium]|nr:hypothetical protein [Flavobacteriaceae bacterium]
MNLLKYSLLTFILLLSFSVSAQKKYDKKIKESFKVNSDVEIEVDVAYTDVDIETWNRNEVAVTAVMEVKAKSKKEAERLLKNWNIEALGNSKKVKISAKNNRVFFSNNYHYKIPENVVIQEFENIEIPEIPELPNIDFPEFFMPEIVIPDIDTEAFEFDYDLYKKDSSYMREYKKKVEKAMKNFNKGEWKQQIKEFRNSEEYEKAMKKYKENMKVWAEEFKNSDWKKNMEERVYILKKETEAYKNKAKDIKDKIKYYKVKSKHDSIKNDENVFFIINESDNPDVEVKKHIKIKVPKNATFNLNVRHGEVNVPNSNKKISANIQYGNFIGGDFNGAKNNLVIANSPVFINVVNSGNITLKNVPNATFGTFSNANLFANSSEVLINKVGSNVALSQRFGNLKVLDVIPQFQQLNIVVDYAKANLNLNNVNFSYVINSKASTFNTNGIITKVAKPKNASVQKVNGVKGSPNSLNKLLLTGVYSTINIQ